MLMQQEKKIKTIQENYTKANAPKVFVIIRIENGNNSLRYRGIMGKNAAI